MCLIFHAWHLNANRKLVTMKPAVLITESQIFFLRMAIWVDKSLQKARRMIQDHKQYKR